MIIELLSAITIFGFIGLVFLFIDSCMCDELYHRGVIALALIVLTAIVTLTTIYTYGYEIVGINQ